MATIQERFERVLRNRKTIVIVLVGSVLCIVFVYNLASWIFLDRIGKNLDEELGKRLQAVAGLVAQVTESDVFNNKLTTDLTEEDRLLLGFTFDGLRQDNQLQAIYLVDRSFRNLVASPKLFAPWETIRYLLDDSLQFRTALTKNQAVASNLHVVSGVRFKSAYAPVKNATGRITGFIVVEASASFFSLLSFFQRGLLVGGIASLIVVIVFTVFIFWMVTLFLRLQESLRRNERLAAMGQMAATVAHEIRNPLGIIKSTSEVLRTRYRRPNGDDELFDFIPSEVDRLNRLVSDFLTFARDRDLTLETVDLVKTIGRAIDDLRQEGRTQQTEIVFSPAVDALLIGHNPDAIRQVILNLVLNAIQAMNGSGRVEVLLAVGTSWGKKSVSISVIDNGPGLPVGTQKIFEPFFTTKTSGSGLGLAVTKQIIEKHGGSIEADNLVGGGAVIRFSLPM